MRQGAINGVIIAFDSAESRTTACSVGIAVRGFTVIGTPTLPPTSSIYQVSLEKLPLMRSDSLTPLLTEALSRYGTFEPYHNLNSLKSAKALIEDPSTTHVSDIGIIFHQSRQVRTKFHLPSTYSLCRASGPITINHTCHPFSLFTLSKFDHGRSPSASIFRTIANEVLSNNSDAKLAKENVSRWINESKGKRKAILSNILDLYESDKDRLPVLCNAPLNKELEALAILLMPTIVEANKSVETQVKQVFEVFDCL